MSKRHLFVTKIDRQRLTDMLEEALARGSRDAVFLKDLSQELSRAKDVDPKEVPPDVVTMNSRVVLEDLGSGETMEYTLVFPDQANVEQGRLSVVSPIGTAILGYSKGDSISWHTPGGSRKLKIVSIPFQPEAAGQFHL